MNDRTVTHASRVVRRGARPVARSVPIYHLEIAEPDKPVTAIRMERAEARIGSARQGNDLVVDDDTVSRLHCEILWDEEGARLRDLASTNGTYVDGHRARDVYLLPGSVIDVGRVRLTFVPTEQDWEEPLAEEDGFGPLLGRSVAMRRLFAILERVAGKDVTVLAEGETGTGKELVARAVHESSPRAGGPFVVVDCGALPASMIQDELFGHEVGAFTGASAAREGLLEQADGGTVFLDEIGELPFELQPNLLRFLEAREVRRIGAKSSTPVDVRVVAATNRDLASEVNSGAFREDLYYRLSVVRVSVPPLRERLEDIPLLVERFVRQALASDPERADAIVRGFDSRALASLGRHGWPGNVRELRNAIERTLVLEGGVITGVPSSGAGDVSPLPPRTTGEGDALVPLPSLTADLDRPLVEQRSELVELFERTYMRAQLERNGRKIATAARASSMDRMYFKRLMKKRGV